MIMLCRSIALFITLVLCLAPTVRAEPQVRQFGNLVYTVPEHFTKGRSDQGWVVLYSDNDKLGVYASIRVYGGAEKKDVNNLQLKDWALRVMKNDLEEDQKVSREPEIKPTQVGRTPALMISRLVADHGDQMEIYVALELPTRYELLRFDGPADDREELRKTSEVVSKYFVPMLGTIRAVSKGGTPVLGKPTPGPLEGVWWGGGLQPGIGIDGMMRLDFATSTYTFFKDGRFCEDVPENGVANFDFDAHAMRDANTVGNYRVQGKKLFLSYVDGDIEELEFDGEVIRDGVQSLTLCRTPPDGFRFAGTRNFVYYSGFAPGMMLGGVSSYSSTTYKKDGTFTLEKGAGSNATFDAGGGFATHSSDEAKGTYRVKDGFVEHTDNTGKLVSRKTIVLSDGTDEGKPKTWILVDGEYVE